MATITLLRLFMILIGITPLLSRRAGCGSGLCLRHGDYDGAVRVDEVLVRDTLHVFFSDRGDFVETNDNEVRLVVADRVLPDRDRASERSEEHTSELQSHVNF